MPTADIHAEPDNIVKSTPMALLMICLSRLWRASKKLLSLGQCLAMGADQSGRNVLCRALGQQALSNGTIFVIKFCGLEKRIKETLTITLTNVFGARRFDPSSVDPGSPQHPVDTPAAGIRNDKHCRALFAGTASSPRAVLQSFGIARDFHVNNKA